MLEWRWDPRRCFTGRWGGDQTACQYVNLKSLYNHNSWKTAALPCAGLSSVNHSFSLSGWFFFTSSSSSLRRISFSVWRGTRHVVQNTHTHTWHTPTVIIKVTTTTVTWLANMSEHLVSSLGSAEILRINCSIGVIPGGEEGELRWVGLKRSDSAITHSHTCEQNMGNNWWFLPVF